jgi:flagellar biosynthesis/type III secretory pathway protein FliH
MGLIKKGHLIEAGVLYLTEQIPQVEAEIEATPPAPSETAILETIEAKEGELKGEELVDYAKGEAEQILKKAMQEAEAIKEHAKQSGLEGAQRIAEETASEKVKEALETLNQAAIERKKIIKDAESEILRLALKVAEQIIKSEVSLHRDVSLNIVSDAISRVSDREQVIIRVSKDDVENIKKYKDRISSIVDGIKSLSIVEDAGVEPGGCVIETNLGYVDARISTKIAAIEEAFRKVK